MKSFFWMFCAWCSILTFSFLIPVSAFAQDLVLSGQVVVDEDSPLALLEGLLVSLSPGMLSQELDETGTFSFSMLERGEYTLEVSGPGVATVMREVSLEDGDVTDLLVEVRIFLRIKGVVTAGDTGEAVRGARVRLENTALSVETDDEGAFALEGLRPGAATVVIEARGYDVFRREVTLEEEDLSLAFALERAETWMLLVEVSGSDGEAVRGARVAVSGGVASGFEPQVTDGEGQAVILALPGGNYGLEVMAEGYQDFAIASVPVQMDTGLSVMLVSTDRVPVFDEGTEVCSVSRVGGRHGGAGGWAMVSGLFLLGVVLRGAIR